MWSQVMCHFVKECKFLFFSLMSNVSHPVSLYAISLSDISFVVPVAFLAASVWIFSRSSLSYCMQLSQISLSYSKICLMKEV